MPVPADCLVLAGEEGCGKGDDQWPPKIPSLVTVGRFETDAAIRWCWASVEVAAAAATLGFGDFRHGDDRREFLRIPPVIFIDWCLRGTAGDFVATFAFEETALEGETGVGPVLLVLSSRFLILLMLLPRGR